MRNVAAAALVVAASFGGGPARAEDPPPAPAASSPAPAKTKCSCPQPRLLARGNLVLDATTSVPAWLHQDAVLAPFGKTQSGMPAAAVTAPIHEVELDLSPFGTPQPSTGRLVRAVAEGAMAEPILLGVLRPKEKSPKDVVGVTLAAAATMPLPTGPAPALQALWIAPLEERERPGCGAFLTHIVAYQAAPGSAPVEGFVVVQERDSAREVTVVDVRMAQTLGLGRVDACGEGMPFSAGAATVIEVRPVSATFGVGEPWRFHDDGTGRTDPVRAGALPATADPELAALGFPKPGEDAREMGLKSMIEVVMGGLVGLAVLLAGGWFVIAPKRKRRLTEFPCPACKRPIPIDMLDPDTDGVMCPSCGAASVWKGATQTAVVQKIEQAPAPSSSSSSSSTAPAPPPPPPKDGPPS